MIGASVPPGILGARTTCQRWFRSRLFRLRHLRRFLTPWRRVSGAGMLLRFALGAVRLLAVLVIGLQGLLPGAVSWAEAKGVDYARYLCLTPGAEPSAETKAAAQELARLLGGEVPEEHHAEGDCPLCMLGQAAMLAAPVLPEAPSFQAAGSPAPHYEPGFIHLPQGPPLGSRAPPIHI